MLENKSSQSFFRKLLNSKILVTLEVIVLFIVIIGLAKEIIRNYQIKSEIKSLQTEIDSIEKKNLELADLIQYFKTETFKEEQAKSRLGMQKEGEKVIALPGEEEVIDPAEEEGYANNTNKLVSNPQKWWNYFIK